MFTQEPYNCTMNTFFPVTTKPIMCLHAIHTTVSINNSCYARAGLNLHKLVWEQILFSSHQQTFRGTIKFGS